VRLRALAGHPWIYRSDVENAEAAPGDLVQVTSGRGRPRSTISGGARTADNLEPQSAGERKLVRRRHEPAGDSGRIDAIACL